jgi:Periplasmic binding protein
MRADAFARRDIPEPQSPGTRRPIGLLPLLSVVLLVGAVSAYAGMTFVARWTAAATRDTPTETSATDARPAATLPPLAAAPEIAAPSSVPGSSTIGIATAAAQSPNPAFRADTGEKGIGVRTANAATPNRAVQGVTDTEIRFGLAAPFSGPAKEMGRQLKLGIETAFAAANENGRLSGRQLKLITADDGYEPARTLNAMK